MDYFNTTFDAMVKADFIRKMLALGKSPEQTKQVWAKLQSNIIRGNQAKNTVGNTFNVV